VGGTHQKKGNSVLFFGNGRRRRKKEKEKILSLNINHKCVVEEGETSSDDTEDLHILKVPVVV